MILALTGPAGCGKSTAAAHLAACHGFERIRFAGPLKAMLRAFLYTADTPVEIVERMIEGDLKESPAFVLAGASPRRAMQTLGTEWGRDLIAPGLWTSAWEAGAAAALAKGAPGVVVEDCRFPNEAAAVLRLGGRIVAIERPAGTVAMAAHPSEGQAIAVDATIRNDGPPEILHARLDGIVRRYALTSIRRTA